MRATVLLPDAIPPVSPTIRATRGSIARTAARRLWFVRSPLAFGSLRAPKRRLLALIRH
jgi:hypothetical protein